MLLMIAEIWEFVKQAAIFHCTHIQLTEYETKKHLNFLIMNDWVFIQWRLLMKFYNNRGIMF